jgi:hypothetical protein
MIRGSGLVQWLIHRSAWKGNSANFALTEFSEVRMYRMLGNRASGVTNARKVAFRFPARPPNIALYDTEVEDTSDLVERKGRDE